MDTPTIKKQEKKQPVTEQPEAQQEFCSCNQKTKVYSRVVGYIRPIDDWNIAKKAEFKDRKTYQINQNSEPTDAD